MDYKTKKKFCQITSFFMTMCLVLVMALGNNVLVAHAEDAMPEAGDILFQIHNAQSGRVYYSIDGEHFDEIGDNGVVNADRLQDVTTITIKYETNEGQRLDDYVDNGMVVNRVYENGTPSALVFDESHITSFTYNKDNMYRVVISFMGGNDNPPGPGPSVNTGDVLFEINNSQSGRVYYSLDGEHFDEIGHNGVISAEDLKEVTTITIKYETNEGQRLDDYVDNGMVVNRVYENGTPSALVFDESNTTSFTYNKDNMYRVTISFMGGNDNPPGPGPEVNTGDVLFEINNSQSGRVYYSLDGEHFDEIGHNGVISAEDLKEVTTITIKYETNEGQTLDDYVDNGMVVNRVYENGTPSALVFDESHITSFTYNKDNTYRVTMSFMGEHNGPGPEDPENPGEFDFDKKVKIALHVTDANDSEKEGNAGFHINGVCGQDGYWDEETQTEVRYQKKELTIPYDESGKVCIDMSSLINARYTSLTINGVDYSDAIPGLRNSETRRQEILEAMDFAGNSQIVAFRLEVPFSETYEISASLKEIDDTDRDFWPTGNFLWSSTQGKVGDDDFIDHAHLEFVRLEYNDGEDHVINSLEELRNENHTYLYFCEDQEINSATLVTGSILTVKIVPEYGYQLVSFGVNNKGFETGEEPCVYTFEIKSGNFHLMAHCESVSDVVAADDSKAVSEGEILIDDQEINVGTAMLSVKDANPNQADVADFEAQAGDYEITSYLDLDMTQIIYKGSTTEYWSEDLSTLKKRATVSLKVEEPIETEQVKVIHQRHDNTYETLDATYDPNTQTVTFETDSFSTFALCNEKVHVHNLTKVAAVDPTCTKAGNVLYYTCDGCDDWFYNKSATKVVVNREDVVVKATGHDYKDVITKASLTKDGSIENKCANCGKVKSTTKISHIDKITLSKTSFVWDGNAKNPAVTVKDAKGKTVDAKYYTVTKDSGRKDVGSYAYKITFKTNYSGSKTLSFVINPKGTSISSLSALSKGFQVKWKAQTKQTTGYEIRYATKSSMSGAVSVKVDKKDTTSKKIAKLKASQKYFVQIRTYKKVGTKTYYSDWSDPKSVTTKK